MSQQSVNVNQFTILNQSVNVNQPDKENQSNTSKESDFKEPILQETGRISAIPLDSKYGEIWANYKLQKKSIWYAEKILLKINKDVATFPSLPLRIQLSTKMVFGFFAGSDEIVEDNLNERFIREIKIPEIKYAYSFQAFMENIHSETYNIIIERVMSSDKANLFRAIEKFECVKAKSDWARKWISSSASYAERCIAFVCVEGIFFSSSFLYIDWLKTQDYDLPAIYNSNEYISNDEARHMELACLVYKHIVKKPTTERIKQIVGEAIAIEHSFVDEVIPPEGYKGMNRGMMRQHVTHAGATAMSLLGYPKLLGHTSTPFSFASKRGLSVKDNFFEQESIQYNMAHVGDKEDESGFSTSADW